MLTSRKWKKILIKRWTCVFFLIFPPIPFLFNETNIQTSDILLPRIVEKAWIYIYLVYASAKERGVKRRKRKRIIFLKSCSSCACVSHLRKNYCSKIIHTLWCWHSWLLKREILSQCCIDAGRLFNCMFVRGRKLFRVMVFQTVAQGKRVCESGSLRQRKVEKKEKSYVWEQLQVSS